MDQTLPNTDRDTFTEHMPWFSNSLPPNPLPSYHNTLATHIYLIRSWSSPKVQLTCRKLSNYVLSYSCAVCVSSLPDFSAHGIFQARILEWVAISFSRRSSQPRDWTRVSCIVGRCFYYDLNPCLPNSCNKYPKQSSSFLIYRHWQGP